jgi:hypothetical protein
MENFFKQEFDPYQEFCTKLQEWCDLYYQPLKIRSSISIKDEKSELFERFKKSYILIWCHHF